LRCGRPLMMGQQTARYVHVQERSLSRVTWAVRYPHPVAAMKVAVGFSAVTRAYE
jgi:hypothetical protein